MVTNSMTLVKCLLIGAVLAAAACHKNASNVVRHIDEKQAVNIAKSAVVRQFGIRKFRFVQVVPANTDKVWVVKFLYGENTLGDFTAVVDRNSGEVIAVYGEQ